MSDTQPSVTTDAAVRACQRQLPASIDGGSVVFGFDGMIDAVQELVDTRHDPDSYTPIRTLDSLADRLRDSAAENSSIAIEWVRNGTRTGGHTAHLTRFFGKIGYDPTMIGTFGRPIRDAFQAEFGEYGMVSLGDPGETHAVEFDDGKCMLVEPGSYLRLDWETLTETVTVDELAARVDGTELLGIGYWTVIPRLPSILSGLREDLWPTLSDPPERVLFDPGDIRQLTADEIGAGVEPLDGLATVADVTLSANRVETLALADRLTAEDPDRTFAEAAAVVYDSLNVSRFVGHNVDCSLSISDAGAARVAVPRVEEPALTTSAGDHFNAGLALGLLQGLDEAAALTLGNAVASRFVRTGSPPSFDEIRATVERYDELLAD